MKKAKRIKSIIVKLSQLLLFIKVKVWIVKYNTDLPHSSLNYKIPEQFEKNNYHVLQNLLLDKWGAVHIFTAPVNQDRNLVKSLNKL